MKVKYIIALFLLGIFITIIGALFKIQHWPYGMEILIGGLAIVIISGIISVIQYSKKKQ